MYRNSLKKDKKAGIIITSWLVIWMVISVIFGVWVNDIAMWSFFWAYLIGTIGFIVGTVKENERAKKEIERERKEAFEIERMNKEEELKFKEEELKIREKARRLLDTGQIPSDDNKFWEAQELTDLFKNVVERNELEYRRHRELSIEHAEKSREHRELSREMKPILKGLYKLWDKQSKELS